MTSTIDHQPRSRRRVLVVGGVALAALFAVGALVQVPRVEDDLASRVEHLLATDGITVEAEFSGQDGTLTCATVLAEPDLSIARAESVWGVRAIELDSSCVRPGQPADSTSTGPTAAPTSATPTSPDTAASTTAAPTTVAATTTTVAPASIVNAQLLDGRLLLSGRVASEAQRQLLLAAANFVVTPANVVDQLGVDASVTIDDATVSALRDLLAAMPLNLVTGEAGWNGNLYATGVFASDVNRAAYEAAGAAVGVVPTLTVRATATAEQALALETELNTLVFLEPILFDKGSTTISAASQATMLKIAGIAKRYAGLRIEVRGHTDSEGDAGRNLTLSEQRSASVRDTLVALGVPVADLVAVGFGATQLVLDANGQELREQSRRVVFGVTII